MPESPRFNTLPLGVSSFKLIRKHGLRYVDKTALIYKIAARYGAKVLLVRPRRFGKSLLVSTLKTLFQDGLTCFKGLAIESLWQDKQYKVLSLDFSDAKDFHTFERFLEKFRAMLNDSFRSCGFTFTIPANEDPIHGFSEFLWQNEELVLLIDEYDAPFNTHLDNLALLESIGEYLSGFYAKIKSRDQCFRFIFITGILKFSQTTVFSGVNNVLDISLDTRYGTLLGYTEDEIKLYFPEYITRAAKVTNKKEEEILEGIKQMYNGFCFDKKASTQVYTPWSVLNFLEKPQEGLDNYWYISGGKPTLLMKKLKNIQDFVRKNFTNNLKITLKDLQISTSPYSIDDIILLFYTGYLTIDKVNGDEVLLKCPNNEVINSFSSLILKEIANDIHYDNNDIIKALSSGNAEGIVNILNMQLLKIDYLSYPIEKESAFRALVQIILDSRKLSPLIEKHNAQGRSDIQVRAGSFLWIFELKILADKKIEDEKKRAYKLDALLKAAIRQVQQKKYGEEEAAENLRRLCMVFSQKEKSIARWQLDPSTLPHA